MDKNLKKEEIFKMNQLDIIQPFYPEEDEIDD